jgi:hypothetical protein
MNPTVGPSSLYGFPAVSVFAGEVQDDTGHGSVRIELVGESDRNYLHEELRLAGRAVQRRLPGPESP